MKDKKYVKYLETATMYAFSILDPESEEMVVKQNALGAVGDHTDHFFYVIKEIHSKGKEKCGDVTLFEVRRFLKEKRHKKTDKKLLFLKAHTGEFEDLYMVKKYFTEGIQVVTANTLHRYHVHAQCLDIYIPNSNDSFRENSLPDFGSPCIRKRIQEGEEYDVRAGQQYLVVAGYHSSFTKKIIRADCSQEAASLSIGNHPHAESNGASINMELDSTSEPRSALSPLHDGKQRRLSDSDVYLRQITTQENDVYPSSHKRMKVASESGCSSTSAVSSFPVHSPDAPVDLSLDTPNLPAAEISRDDRIQSCSLPNSNGALENGKEENLSLPSTSQPSKFQKSTSRATSVRGNVFKKPGLAVCGILQNWRVKPYTIVKGGLRFENSRLTGSFMISEKSMSPPQVKYTVRNDTIKEVGFFENGSKSIRSVTITDDLLDQLSKNRRYLECTVVKYFFTITFEYLRKEKNKMDEVLNMYFLFNDTNMIPSCVPAILQMSGSNFVGTLPEEYKP